MHDIRITLGLLIFVSCAMWLFFIVVSHYLKWKLPRFLIDNYNEITLLTVVSLLMGLILIVF